MGSGLAGSERFLHRPRFLTVARDTGTSWSGFVALLRGLLRSGGGYPNCGCKKKKEGAAIVAAPPLPAHPVIRAPAASVVTDTAGWSDSTVSHMGYGGSASSAVLAPRHANPAIVRRTHAVPCICGSRC